jgi:hypothetical protein
MGFKKRQYIFLNVLPLNYVTPAGFKPATLRAEI